MRARFPRPGLVFQPAGPAGTFRGLPRTQCAALSQFPLVESALHAPEIQTGAVFTSGIRRRSHLERLRCLWPGQNPDPEAGFMHDETRDRRSISGSPNLGNIDGKRMEREAVCVDSAPWQHRNMVHFGAPGRVMASSRPGGILRAGSVCCSSGNLLPGPEAGN